MQWNFALDRLAYVEKEKFHCTRGARLRLFGRPSTSQLLGTEWAPNSRRFSYWRLFRRPLNRVGHRLWAFCQCRLGVHIWERRIGTTRVASDFVSDVGYNSGADFEAKSAPRLASDFVSDVGYNSGANFEAKLAPRKSRKSLISDCRFGSPTFLQTCWFLAHRAYCLWRSCSAFDLGHTYSRGNDNKYHDLCFYYAMKHRIDTAALT